MKSIFFLFFIVTFQFSFSQTEVYVHKDTIGKSTIETIKEKKFEPVQNYILEKYSKDIYWIKIPAFNTNSNYIFRLLYERYNEAEAYLGSNCIEQLPNQRYLSYKFSRESDVFIKIDPELHSYIPFELLSEEKSLLKNQNHLLMNGFYYGFAFLVIILNFLYYILFKDDAFLYYSLFLATITFGVFTMDGMLNFYGITGNINNFIMISNYILLAFFSSKFINKYLFLDIYQPKLKKISYFFGFVIIIFGLLFIGYENFYFLIILNILVFSLLLIYWISAILLFKNNIYTKILVFAYSIILFSGIDYYVFKFLGISILNIDAVTIKVGAFLEMIFLSIAVLYRMNTLKNENKFMRNEIISFSKKMNELTQNQKLIKTNKLVNLSLREREIFDLILKGKTNKELANELNISINTIKFHIKNIYDKLQVNSRKEAMSIEKSLI